MNEVMHFKYLEYLQVFKFFGSKIRSDEMNFALCKDMQAKFHDFLRIFSSKEEFRTSSMRLDP